MVRPEKKPGQIVAKQTVEIVRKSQRYRKGRGAKMHAAAHAEKGEMWYDECIAWERMTWSNTYIGGAPSASRNVGKG